MKPNTTREDIILGVQFAIDLSQALFLCASRSKLYQEVSINSREELDQCITKIKKEFSGKRVPITYRPSYPFDIIKVDYHRVVDLNVIRNICYNTLKYRPHDRTIRVTVNDLVAQYSDNNRVKRRALNIFKSSLGIADSQTLNDKVEYILTQNRSFVFMGNGFYNVRADGTKHFLQLIRLLESKLVPEGKRRKTIWIVQPPKDEGFIAHVLEDEETITVSVLPSHTIKRNNAK